MSKAQHTTPQLRFPEFDGDWQFIQLSKLLEFKNGINASKEQYGKGYKFINVLDILSNDYITHELIKGKVDIDETTFNKNVVAYGDILFQRSSETREEVGTASVYLDKDNLATFGGFVIRGKKIGNYEPIFFNKLLQTNLSRQEITSKSGGSTRYNVGQEILSNISLPFPSIVEQTKIASFLTAVDDKLQALKKKKEALEHYKKGMMQKLFSQEIRFKDDHGNEFPDWENKKLGEVISQVSKRNKKNDVQLVLSVSNTKGFIPQSEQFDGHRVASKDTTNYKIVKQGDIAYNPSRINVGSIATLKEFETGIISPMYVIFRTKKDMLNTTFFDALKETHLFKHSVKMGCSGSVRDSLNFDDLARFNIFLPSIEEQTKIANFLSALDDKINQVEKQVQGMEQWKKGLLQKLFV